MARLLKARNTGHPGGVTTIHSNTAESGLRHLEQITAEASQQPMREVIGEAVDLIVSIERAPSKLSVNILSELPKWSHSRCL